MNPSVTTSAPDLLATYQMVVYNCAVYPASFQSVLKTRTEHTRYSFDCWLMSGQHMFRLDRGRESICELLTADDHALPESGIVAGFYCAGERDYSHKFSAAGVEYMTTVQTESLSENLYRDTRLEMLEFARESEALTHSWTDLTGECLSLVDVQKMATELHAHSYHLIASGGLVIRTQTIFELI